MFKSENTQTHTLKHMHSNTCTQTNSHTHNQMNKQTNAHLHTPKHKHTQILALSDTPRNHPHTSTCICKCIDRTGNINTAAMFAYVSILWSLNTCKLLKRNQWKKLICFSFPVKETKETFQWPLLVIPIMHFSGETRTLPYWNPLGELQLCVGCQQSQDVCTS